MLSVETPSLDADLRLRTGAGLPKGDDTPELIVRWQRDRDRTSRDALVERFMPLARGLARRYGRSSEPFEDLLQVAALGLLKAVDRFDPGRGSSFASFAVPTILGEMRRHFRDCGWAVHVPRQTQERALKVRDADERLTGAQGRAPSVGQLAEYLELDVEDVLDALAAIQAYETLPLDGPRSRIDEEAIAPYSESLGREDERYELVELDATVASALVSMPARERTILRLRFFDDLTQTEIAHRVGVSQMQVSRLLRRSLARLRTLADAGQGVVDR
jgi:RNA polymerase sigma-B factor